jgi:hypothetical protein
VWNAINSIIFELERQINLSSNQISSFLVQKEVLPVFQNNSAHKSHSLTPLLVSALPLDVSEVKSINEYTKWYVFSISSLNDAGFLNCYHSLCTLCYRQLLGYSKFYVRELSDNVGVVSATSDVILPYSGLFYSSVLENSPLFNIFPDPHQHMLNSTVYISPISFIDELNHCGLCNCNSFNSLKVSNDIISVLSQLFEIWIRKTFPDFSYFNFTESEDSSFYVPSFVRNIDLKSSVDQHSFLYYFPIIISFYSSLYPSEKFNLSISKDNSQFRSLFSLSSSYSSDESSVPNPIFPSYNDNLNIHPNFSVNETNSLDNFDKSNLNKPSFFPFLIPKYDDSITLNTSLEFVSLPSPSYSSSSVDNLCKLSPAVMLNPNHLLLVHIFNISLMNIYRLPFFFSSSLLPLLSSLLSFPFPFIRCAAFDFFLYLVSVSIYTFFLNWHLISLVLEECCKVENNVKGKNGLSENQNVVFQFCSSLKNLLIPPSSNSFSPSFKTLLSHSNLFFIFKSFLSSFSSSFPDIRNRAPFSLLILLQTYGKYIQFLSFPSSLLLRSPFSSIIVSSYLDEKNRDSFFDLFVGDCGEYNYFTIIFENIYSSITSSIMDSDDLQINPSSLNFVSSYCMSIRFMISEYSFNFSFKCYELLVKILTTILSFLSKSCYVSGNTLSIQSSKSKLKNCDVSNSSDQSPLSLFLSVFEILWMVADSLVIIGERHLPLKNINKNLTIEKYTTAENNSDYLYYHRFIENSFYSFYIPPTSSEVICPECLKYSDFSKYFKDSPSVFKSELSLTFPISNPTCSTLEGVLLILANIIDAATMYSRLFYLFFSFLFIFIYIFVFY